MKANDYGIGELLKGKPMAANPAGAPHGLYILLDWISEEEEQEIVDFLSKDPWSNDISSARPTKHFGYRYAYAGVNSSWTKDEKDWEILRSHADRIEREIPGIQISQCLANLYFKQSAIGAHRDKETPTVFGLSFVGDINMIWTYMKDPKIKYEACIPRRSLYIMCDDAAFEWKHEVPNRATVSYPELNQNDPRYGQLIHKHSKPDWYTRVSITYRHFQQPMAGQTSSIPKSPDGESQTTREPDVLEAVFLKGMIPLHREKDELLFREHPWKQMSSRFGATLSRLVCHESHRVSETSGIYGVWLEMFCQSYFGVQVNVQGCFANLYPDGKSTLPAHKDIYNGLWVMGLSFGETRTFDFILNGVKPTAKTAPAGAIVNVPMESGDILIFSPNVNNTHKHRILAEPQRKGRRINLTYFVQVPKNEEQKILRPPQVPTTSLPTFEQAQIRFQQRQTNPIGIAQNMQGEGVMRMDIIQDEQGQMYIMSGEQLIPVDSIEEAMINLGIVQ